MKIFAVAMLFGALLAASTALQASQILQAQTPSHNIIPRPVEQTFHKGVGISQSEDMTVDLKVDESLGLPPEGYRIVVGEGNVEITGADQAGLFYVKQTLTQMFPPDGVEKIDIPRQTIVDYPRFAYRGFSLDVARTFSGVDTIKAFIDRMAAHKLNRLHWHLTDDQAWRIEIKGHPELAQVGGFRGGASPVKNVFGAWGKRYGGYYTQQQITEVVRYAAERHITVIPEIDLPGHSMAAARVWPHILCRGEVDSTAAGFDMRNVWCVAREENYKLLDDILREVCELFPSEYIYLGGDEVDPAQWLACPDCQALMRREGFTDVRQLSGYFMQMCEEILAKYGKRLAVWNEATNGGNLPKENTMVYAWENMAAVRKSLSEERRTVVMPAQYFYFDMAQAPDERGVRWAGIVDAEKVYSFDFGQEWITPAMERNVVGVEGAFWAEMLLQNREKFPELNYLDYMIFPRLCALAEVAWSPSEARDWGDFERRLTGVHYRRLAAMGIDFRNPAQGNRSPDPSHRNSYATSGSGLRVIRPAVKLTSNVPASPTHPYSFSMDYSAAKYGASSRAPRKGDWWLFEFGAPVTCHSVLIWTGYYRLAQKNIGEGFVEVSYDGETFETIVEDFDTYCTIYPRAPLHAIRLNALGEGNGDVSAYIQDLIITAE